MVLEVAMKVDQRYGQEAAARLSLLIPASGILSHGGEGYPQYVDA
jgi:hypothetical protein